MSRNITRVALLPVILGTFALVACRGDGGTGPTPPPTLDQVLYQASVSSVAGGATTIGVAQFVPPAASNCSYDPGTRWFGCGPVTTGGVTYTRAYALLDGAGALQPQFGPDIVAVRTRVAMRGTQAPNTTVDASEDMTLSGLLSGTYVLDGTFTGGVIQATVTTPSISIQTHRDGQVTHLVLPSTPGAYPRGTITFDASSSIGGVWGPVYHNVMEYDGTSVLKVTTSSGTVSTTCAVDLVSPSSKCVD